MVDLDRIDCWAGGPDFLNILARWPRAKRPNGTPGKREIAFKSLVFPPFGGFGWLREPITNHGNAYKTLRFLTFRYISGGVETAKIT